MNIDMRIAHGDPGSGKDLLHPVEHIVIARPIILCARPEAQDILDRAVAVGDDVRLDRPVAERLFMRCRSGAEGGADLVRRIVIGRRDVHVDPAHVLARHVDDAFSYLIEQQNTTYLVPGVNLRSVGTIRDAQKWPKRDKRKDPNRLDQINYNLLSPYTIQKMMKGRSILKELRKVSGETSETYSYQSAKIKNSSLNNGIRFYETAIHKFLGNSLIKRLEEVRFSSDEEIRARLIPDTEIGTGEWVDISGLIAPKSEIEKLMADIESGILTNVDQIHDRFVEMHRNYYTYEWTWAYGKMLEFYNLRSDEITAKDVIAIVKKWQEAVVGLDKMVYADAKKEFSLSAMTGFGADGSREEMEQDFEQVRGVFESNPFVTAVLQHIEAKTALGNELIERIASI